MQNINWKLVLDKVGTVIVDRRFWVSLFTAGLLVFGSPEVLGNVDSLSDQAVEVSQAIVQIIGMLVPFITLIGSWTKRAPSGLNFKETTTAVKIKKEDLLEALQDMFGTSA